jgi:hypothetical protein
MAQGHSGFVRKTKRLHPTKSDYPAICEERVGEAMSLEPRRRRLLLVLLASDALAGLINLIIAHRAHSVINEAVAISVWFVIAPVFSLWWVRNTEADG